MKRLLFLQSMMLLLSGLYAQNNVGIGTNTPTPTAVLHIDAGQSASRGFLVTGTANQISSSIPNLGAGSRMMFYPAKAAFRAGHVTSTQWDSDNTGFASIAMGVNTTASGSLSIALGNNTTASHNFSTALGSNSTASGNTSTAMGASTLASGVVSTALGSNTTASGNSSVAMGNATMASGLNATAMGNTTVASGYNSTALGNNTIAKANNALSIGSYNDDSDSPNPVSIEQSDRVFQIGIGSTNNNRNNAMTVLRNGNTGIGILDPTYRLDLAGRMRIRSGGMGSSSAGIWLNRNDNSVLAGFIGVDGNNDLGIFTSANSSWSFLVNNTTGNVTVKGTVTANGVTLTSDERLKKDIVPLGNAMQLLEKLNGYQYHWKDETWDASLQTGLLAQELEKVMPELVKADEQGILSVNYSGLIPYLLEAAKEQQVIIKSLQTELNELKQIMKQLAGK